MKKIISILLIFTLIVGFLPTQSFAQEAILDSTTPTPFEQDQFTPEANISDPTLAPELSIPEVNVLESLSPEDTLFNSLTEEENSLESAVFNLPIRVHQLKKNSFRGDEKITIVIENAKTSDVDISLFDVDGQEVSVEIEKVSEQDPVVLRLIPPTKFKAGRYRLVINDSEGNITTQNFTWGVLAINPNKSIYLPNETSRLAMAVLDETGLMICDAQVELRITNQELGINDTLSTSNGLIKVNPDCDVKDYTPNPDYEATYQVKAAGAYDLYLSAITKNGTYSITDSFDVRDYVPFDVERVNATRIFPPITYSSMFNIIANEDFDGVITETVPDVFGITPIADAVSYDSISSVSAQTATEDILKGDIPQLNLPYQGTFAISQKFGSEIRDPLVAAKYSQFGLVGHDGIDFDLLEGEAVLAADDGEVVRATTNGDYGTTVVIQHEWGKSYYGHLSDLTSTYVGKKVQRGGPIGLSGSTGLSSGPHLHFGIKPSKNDPNNGYYGKINPLSYLGLEAEQKTDGNIVFSSGGNESYGVKVISWRVSLKKGLSIKLGYGYKVPSESPQFYLLGPLQFTNTQDEVVFQESRQWQLAIDADGSGTNTVSPTTGTISTTGNTYAFTFTATETMDSGGIRITVPSSGSPNWSAPQGTAGTAGYTTAVGNGAATVADILNNADVEDPTSPAGIWNEVDADMCGASTAQATDIVANTTTKKEGTASIECATAAAPDINDSWGFIYDANQDWSTFCGGSACTQLGYWIRAAGTGTNAEFEVSSTTDVEAGALGANCPASVTTANTWEYKKCSLSGLTLTTVRSFGFRCTNNVCTPFETGSFFIDEILIGPGVPTFAGTGPWDINARILDAANTETITVTYGSGGGSSGVTNSSTEAVHTFTTASRISVTGTLTNISSNPTVTLSSGPTNNQLMRHGKWFDAGSEKAFTF